MNYISQEKRNNMKNLWPCARFFEKQILDDLAKVGVFATRVAFFGDGSSQSTCRIDTGTVSLVLKLFNPSHYNALQNEIALLHKLAVHYNSALLPLHNKPIIITGKPSYIYMFFDGNLFSEVSIKEKYFEFGKIVAEFDIALQKLPIDLSIITNNDLLSLPLQRYPDISTSQLIIAATQLFNKEVCTFDFDQIRKQYIHKDLHFYNVLYSSANERHSIIDTSGMSVQFLPREIAVSMGNTLLDSFDNFSSSNVKELMRGYSTTTKFNTIEKRIIPLFIIQKKLGEIAYLHKQILLPGHNPRTTEVLEKYRSLSQNTLKYVIGEYDYLTNFFSDLD